LEHLDVALAGLGGVLGGRQVVWKLDRLGRSVIDLNDIITDLRRREVSFRSLTEHIDTSTAQGWLFFQLLAAFAEFERELIIERTIAGKQRMIAAGEHPGGVPMYGFEADHVTENEHEASLLREAARRLLDVSRWPRSWTTGTSGASGHVAGRGGESRLCG
jgi:DNA invertase Pin-like site-specific DNA recombinase